MEEYLYHYNAKVVSVYDGDTIRVNISFGFGHNWNGENGKGVSLRLYGLNTPEVRGDEKERGLMVRDKLRELILDKHVTLRTIKDKTGKYGRYLAIIVTKEGLNVNDWLIENGYAEAKEY
jgi:micrococcal nuclease